MSDSYDILLNNMEKNPISFLQEYMMASKKEIPNYVIVQQSVGTHINSFHMRVKCEGLVAEGIGSSKKEAKTNTAINMLKLLKLYPSQIPVMPSSPNSSDNTNNYNCRINNDFQNTLTDSTATSINYIGKLQELTAHKTSSPIYTLKSVSGPPHNSLFTYICKYEEREEEATSKTKKEAKSLAAKKMLEKISAELQIIVPQEEYQNYLDTIRSSIKNLEIYEDNKRLMMKSASKALENYPKVNKTGKKILTDNDVCDEYHKFLKNSFTNNERRSAINQLQEAIELCKNYSKGFDKFINPKSILQTALEVLNIEMCEVTYLNVKECNIYGLKLLTNPTISEIGYGINKVAAENMAIYEIAKTLSIMLL